MLAQWPVVNRPFRCDFNGAGFFLELPLQEIIRYTKGSVREHNLLKNQFVHTKFLLNRYFTHPAIVPQGTHTGVPKGLANIKYVNLATLSRLVALIFAPKKIMSNQVKEMAVRLKPLLNEGDVGCKWESSLDKIFSPGNYVVEIDHTGSNVGLPVEFCGAEHYIVGNLVVTDSGTAGPKQHDRVIGQSLTFTTRESKATKVYTRTYANGRWGEWHSLIEAGAFDKITTTDELISIVAAISNDVNTLKGAGDGSIAAVVGAAVEKGRTLAKRDLFIAAGALYNDTDAAITRTAPWGERVQHLPGHYYLNGLGDITEKQMFNIYNSPKNVLYKNAYTQSSVNSRTIIANVGQGTYSMNIDLTALCCDRRDIEVFGNNSVVYFRGGSLAYAFYNCSALKHIPCAGFFIKDVDFSNTFKGCTSLITVRFQRLSTNISFSDSPNISKDSILFMIQKAQPNTAITITLHADAYVRLESDADIVAALEAQPLLSLVSA